MKLYFVTATALLIGLALGGFLGATAASKRAAEDAYLSSLFWFIAVERDLQSRNLERADDLSLTATDATLMVLNQLKNKNQISSGWLLLTQESPSSQEEKLVASARDILEPRLEELSDESRDFLAEFSAR